MEAEADQSKFIVWNRIFYINVNIEFYFKKSKFISSNQIYSLNRSLFCEIDIYLFQSKFIY